MMEFGVQTFTVRKRQKKSIREAYLPLINLGVKTFEVARIDFTGRNARELRALADEYGVRIASIQVKPKYVFGHPDKAIKAVLPSKYAPKRKHRYNHVFTP